jgi:tRNA(Arg) A34 adenosine deaminase TadA
VWSPKQDRAENIGHFGSWLWSAIVSISGRWPNRRHDPEYQHTLNRWSSIEEIYMPVSPERDIELLRRTIELARESRTRGDHPFGALLAGPDGNILIEAMNTGGTLGDRTGHAERNLMTEASLKYETDFLTGCTMYTSAEPCAMCAGSVYWTGVGRVVHGMSEVALKDLIGPDPENLTMDLPCRDVFAAGQRSVEVVGPLLEDESATVHEGFWSSFK